MIRTIALAVMGLVTASVLTVHSQTNQQILQGGGPLPPRDARPATPTATATSQAVTLKLVSPQGAE
jgi:hypothetical protein